MKSFIAGHLKKIIPLMNRMKLACWEAAISGRQEDYDKYSKMELEIRKIYSDADEFTYLKKIKETGSIKDSKIARQIAVLHNAYLENQIEPELLKEIVNLGTEVERKASTFRGAIRGKKVTDNEIKEILKSEKDSNLRREAWIAGKQVGGEVADHIVALVRLRNKAARKLGFDNYHSLSLTAAEQDTKELDQLFDQLYKLTNEPFTRLKAELDSSLAERYGVASKKLMPWHYHDPFFQEAPLLYNLDFDSFYRDKDVSELSLKFYSGIGLPVDSILKNSDLYEREGKNPHAFCEDMDREGDVRILCNLKNNERWMRTVLHELGHAVYSKYQDPEMPYLLREQAHIFTTEAVAMFFGRLSRNALWMQKILGLSLKELDEISKVSGRYAQLKQLIFARWAMVMYDFEKKLYADPDQDLNNLWWRIVGKYQLLNKPDDRDKPDWASKIHFAVAPCYYHNYMLGELLASQLYHCIPNKDADLVDCKDVGEFFRKNIFMPGKLYHWNEMIKRATGEPLTAKYFVEQFVNTA